MKHLLLSAVLAAGLAVPAWADVTVKSTGGGRGMGMSGKTSTVTYIKGHKMRVETQARNNVQTVIFDVDAQRMYSFDSRRKEADVWDMGAFAGEISQSVDTANMKASITPTGETKQIAGRTADGYTMMISVPAAMGGDRNAPQMTVTLEGPLWIVKDAPGTAEYAAFYLAAAEKGWIFSDPRAAKAQPGQAKAMAEMHRRFAEIGGIPYETEMQVKMAMGEGGAGPLGGLMSRMGNISITSLVESVETGPLADDLFAPPAGYKLNQRQ